MSNIKSQTKSLIGQSLSNVGLGIGILALAGCSGATGNVAATDPTERGLSYIAAAVVTHAIISLFR